MKLFDLYLELLKSSLTDTLHEQSTSALLQASRGVKFIPTIYSERIEGRDWPSRAETMIGMHRLNNIQHCLECIIADDIPGDLIETGVWRGGAVIFMCGFLRAHEVKNRSVWAADSFEGLPKPDPRLYPADATDIHNTIDFLKVSQEEVESNFRRYGLLDGQVKFLKGWFKDTLPTLRGTPWALLRLDGDMYQSTAEALINLYDDLSPGGFIIIDDYGCLSNCKQAVDDFRAARQIKEPIQKIDWTGVYWRKES